MRTLATAIALLALLAGSGCASSQTGVLWKHDALNGTLAIGDSRYVVTDQTRLFAPDGRRIRLAEVPKVSDPGVGVRNLDQARVEFTTWEFAGEQFVDELWVRPAR